MMSKSRIALKSANDGCQIVQRDELSVGSAHRLAVSRYRLSATSGTK